VRGNWLCFALIRDSGVFDQDSGLTSSGDYKSYWKLLGSIITPMSLNLQIRRELERVGNRLKQKKLLDKGTDLASKFRRIYPENEVFFEEFFVYLQGERIDLNIEIEDDELEFHYEVFLRNRSLAGKMQQVYSSMQRESSCNMSELTTEVSAGLLSAVYIFLLEQQKLSKGSVFVLNECVRYAVASLFDAFKTVKDGLVRLNIADDKQKIILNKVFSNPKMLLVFEEQKNVTELALELFRDADPVVAVYLALSDFSSEARRSVREAISFFNSGAQYKIMPVTNKFDGLQFFRFGTAHVDKCSSAANEDDTRSTVSTYSTPLIKVS
jgi:hypothetical protein